MTTAKNYQPTIGLEIHIELKTKTKMFCGCLNENEKIGSAEILAANKNVCPICLAHPGTMPVPNVAAIKAVIKAGLALNCELAEKSKFDRKQYFYPDLPKGYQISQYDAPLCQDGYLEINQKKIGITRIHLEEDTAKLTHTKEGTLIDFNRAGVPLMELVTEPEIESGAEAKEFCQELQAILRELEISDANMEKGQMRCEVNISLSATKNLGTKVEIKNLNSFRAVEKSIDYEIKRQTKILEANEKIIQETRGWNESVAETFSQRAKEGSADYRYFPEPDIPPLIFKANNKEIDLKKIKRELPELPADKRKRFSEEYGFNNSDAKIITSDPLLADYTERIVSEIKIWLQDCGEFEGTAEEIWQNNKDKAFKLMAGWLTSKLAGLLTARKLSWAENTISAENMAEFITMILTKKVSSKNANILLEKMLETGGDPSQILEDEDLKTTTDFDLEKVITEIINKNPEQVAQFKAGKVALLKFFLGQVMKESKGQAEPMEAEQILIKKLSDKN
ncbi:MAG TPA: Asp-tRNA(Asn)/Glu-tRNA(Gln) amidotransferase subunit GatB [bacterium]|nr:Asp-tRNA(Asn)/Glu-tRNA(Gln) amidotransferase subunit GatB [bacterium]HPL95483.1 Asp-tRNA(Asn)/Glu-tRNA(Gln) amidotransferase subunit GatB [bacterium]